MVPRSDAAEVMAAIAEHRATLMDGVPTAYYYLLAHQDFDDADLSSLTRCWVGGQTLPEAKAIEFTERTGCPIHEVWGMTELAGSGEEEILSSAKQARHDRDCLSRVTRCEWSISTIPNVVLGPGQRGELMFRGPLVMAGYFGNEDATRASIEPKRSAPLRRHRDQWTRTATSPSSTARPT